jgi:uncharacterized cofD-like protein
MTQPGETDNFTTTDHLKVLRKYGGKDILDCVISNSGDISKELKDKYLKSNCILVTSDEKEVKDLGIALVQENILKVENGIVKHDSERLAEVLIDTIMEKKLLYDKKKIIEYMYLSQRIKEREKKEKK